MLAGILKGGFDSIAYGSVHHVRQDDPARLRQPFQSSSDVDAIAVHRAVGLFDHVAQVHADTKAHAAVFRYGLYGCTDFLLDRERRSHRARGRLEHRQYRVTRHIDDPALVGFNLSAKYRTGSVQRRQRGTVVASHQARVTRCVCCENCHQPLFEMTITHQCRPFLEPFSRIILLGQGLCEAKPKAPLSARRLPRATTVSDCPLRRIADGQNRGEPHSGLGRYKTFV